MILKSQNGNCTIYIDDFVLGTFPFYNLRSDFPIYFGANQLMDSNTFLDYDLLFFRLTDRLLNESEYFANNISCITEYSINLFYKDKDSNLYLKDQSGNNDHMRLINFKNLKDYIKYINLNLKE